MQDTALYTLVEQEKLIDHLKKGEPYASKAMKELYTNYNYKNYLDKYSSEFNTTLQQNTDFFHEAFITFIKKAKRPGFKLPGDVNVYITSIAKNLIQNYSRKVKHETIIAEDKAEYGVAESPSVLYMMDESKAAVRGIMSELKTTCRRLLRLWQNGYTNDEIRDLLEMRTNEDVRKKRYRCLKKIMDLLPQFPELKELHDEK